jgi:hypothetical protein
LTKTTLPIHVVTGSRAVGWRKARRGETGPQPIWPICGGSGEDDDESSGTDDGAVDEKPAGDDLEDEPDPEGADKLGDPGKKALDAMKERFKTERARRIAAEAERDEARKPKPVPKPSAKAPSPEGKADEDTAAPDADEIRRQVEAELKAEQAKERVLDKIELKAAKSFADPVDAVSLLLREHKIEHFLDDGKPDVEAIQDALTELLEKKPYLGAAAQGGKNRFQGSAEGGAKPHKPQRPQSLHEAVNRRYNASQ